MKKTLQIFLSHNTKIAIDTIVKSTHETNIKVHDFFEQDTPCLLLSIEHDQLNTLLDLTKTRPYTLIYLDNGFEAVIELIANRHHQIIALARTEEKLNKLQKIAFALNPGCNLYVLKFDIAHDSYENILIPYVKQKLGTVDVLINNAGSLINKSFMQTTQLDFAEMLQNNLLGHINMIQHLAPLMPPKSHILNIGSMGGFQGSVKFPGLAAYSASKAALHTLTECLAIEFADKQIAVNCLALGSAQTEMLEKAFPDYQSPVLAFEMGKYIADFALSGHKFFNGKIIPVAHSTP